MMDEHAQLQQERQSLTSLVKWGGSTFSLTTGIALLAHGGPTSVVVGTIAGIGAMMLGRDTLDAIHEKFKLPLIDDRITERKSSSKRTPWQRALGVFPEDAPDLEMPEEALPDTEQLPEEEETIFTASTDTTMVTGIPRVTVDACVAHTERNSFAVFLGRSLTRPNNPAAWINFYKRHIKLIGASQHGKSSMAAALLEAITATHDPDRVQVALLDLEDRTSRLFADVPHLARVRKGGTYIRLHARSYDEVLEHLGYINALIDYRYRLSLEELAAQPLLIVYLEEFLDLKNHFKALADTSEQAKDAYVKLVYIIKKIAARGLKVLVQLLMCSQVNYRDEDLQEALVNVTSGLSFCVLPTAAQAAGFYQSELLARTAKEDKIGVAVAQFSDCNDIILAPDYDLEARLRALVDTPRYRYETHVIDITQRETPTSEEEEDQPVTPDMLARALHCYDQGHRTVHALALALNLSPWNVRPIYTQVKQLREGSHTHTHMQEVSVK